MWDSIIIVSCWGARHEPEKSRPLHHHLPLIAALALTAGPVAADFPALRFATPAVQIGQRQEAPVAHAFPIAAFDGQAVPARHLEGSLDQRAFRLDGARANTLALMQPLRAQLEQFGYLVIFACATTDCGGFDFRFGMDVLPEPQMHVDLGDFRYLAAENAQGDMVSLLVSRALDQGFVQVTALTAGPGADLAPDPAPDPATDPTPTLADPASADAAIAGPAIADTGVTQPGPDSGPSRPEPGSLAGDLAQAGSAALDDLDFASGKATLQEGDYPSLAALADWLKAHPDQKVTLVGHTDAIGALAGNIDLSRQRAAAVRDRLTADYGVAKAQMDAQGAGYLAPRATNQTPEGRQINRRVEVIVTTTPVK